MRKLIFVKENIGFIILVIFALVMVLFSYGCFGSESKSEAESVAVASLNTTDSFVGTQELENQNENSVVVNLESNEPNIQPKAWHENNHLIAMLWFILVGFAVAKGLPWFGISKVNEDV